MTQPGYHRVFRNLLMDWTEDALCAGPGTWRIQEWFFVERNADNKHVQILPHERQAKALCIRCPVRRQCLEQGFKEEYGIWGGALPWERREAKNDEHRTDRLLEMLDDQAEKEGLVSTAEEVA